MMEKELIVAAIRASTAEVFSTMLGLEVVNEEAYEETHPPGPSDGIIAVVGLAGVWIGTAGVCCNAATACLIASAMLGVEYAEVGEDVLDAISEIANMIIGSFKTAAELRLGPLGLSIPTVIYGLNFSARSTAKEKWIVTPFTFGAARMDVKICLTPNRGLPALALKTASYPADALLPAEVCPA